MASVDPDGTCPLAAVHQRLEHAHQLWHQTLVQYFDPVAFSVALQSCIQTLRTVTFILQNHKRIIPDFDAWYAPWQEKMRSDPVMKWSVTARNKIEKQGDLVTHSMVRARVVASYHDDGLETEIKAELFDGVQTIFDRIPRYVLEHQVLKHGTLQVERRWVDSELPTHELLDALAYVYGQLELLVGDAHRPLGFDMTVPASDGPSIEHLEGRRACMATTDDVRTVNFSLKDGSILDLQIQSSPNPFKTLDDVKQRYGADRSLAPYEQIRSLQDLSRWLFEHARRVFQVDGYHGSIFLLVRNHRVIRTIGTNPDDRAQKYLIMRQIADAVLRSGADAVVGISEVWTGPANPQDPFDYPADRPEKGEALTLTAFSKQGEGVHLEAEIVRVDGNVKLGETIEIEHAEIGRAPMFAPILSVWRNWPDG